MKPETKKLKVLLKLKGFGFFIKILKVLVVIMPSRT